MDSIIDPYWDLLDIPPAEQPPDHYRLLGLKRFESSPQAITSAADRRSRSLRQHLHGLDPAAAHKLLNEVAQARHCLLNPQTKTVYDHNLRHPPEPRPTAAGPTRPASNIPRPPNIRRTKTPTSRPGPARPAPAPPVRIPIRKEHSKAWGILFGGFNLTAPAAIVFLLGLRGAPADIAIPLLVMVFVIGGTGVMQTVMVFKSDKDHDARSPAFNLLMTGLIWAFAVGFCYLLDVHVDRLPAYATFASSVDDLASFQTEEGGQPQPGGGFLLIRQPGGLRHNHEPTLAEAFFLLPQDLRPTDAADVRVVVWLKFRPVQVGKYDTGGAAYRIDCQLTAIDVATRRIIDRATIAGNHPPSSVTQANPSPTDHYGSFDDTKIVNYIQRLALGARTEQKQRARPEHE